MKVEHFQKQKVTLQHDLSMLLQRAAITESSIFSFQSPNATGHKNVFKSLNSQKLITNYPLMTLS